MDRRELLRAIAALTGCAFVGAERAAAFVWVDPPDEDEAYGPGPIALLDEIAETILPRTDTPGAKDAKVGRFIAHYSLLCYAPTTLAALRDGVIDLNVRARRTFGTEFARGSTTQKQKLLIDIDAEAKRDAKSRDEHSNKPPHWFTLFKQLTLMGFFTSEAGATRAARYRPVPGPYKGVVAYKGETFWAW